MAGRRGRWLLPILVIALVVPACSSSGASAAFGRAERICESFVPPSASTTVASAVQSEMATVDWTTAGQITLLARRQLGHALHPWDQLPTDHFVAECGYVDLTVTTTTISCPGTTLPGGGLVGPNVSQQFYIDAEHQSTAAIPPTSIAFPAPCVYGLVSPTTR